MVGSGLNKGDCRAWLREELEERRRGNAAYSLNAFSKSLGVSAASLSQILSGRRPLTRKTAVKIASRCFFTPEKSRAFVASAMGVDVPEVKPNDDNWTELEIDTFRTISDWRHFAVLSLGDVKPNFAEPKWIAEHLGIKVEDAAEVFERLLRLGLVKRHRRGFRQATKPLETMTTRTSAMVKYHTQNLNKALEALEGENPPLELFSALTMAVDESQLPLARQLIKNFRRSLCQLLEAGKRERVYTLAIQLFPISKGVR